MHCGDFHTFDRIPFLVNNVNSQFGMGSVIVCFHRFIVLCRRPDVFQSIAKIHLVYV